MKTETLDKIKLMKSVAQNLSTFHEQFQEKYMKDHRCDKQAYGFSVDNRFAAFRLNTSFDSYAGYYGNSGCSTTLRFGTEGENIVSQYLIRALNIHQRLLFETAAKEIAKDAALLVSAPEKEVEAMGDMVRKLKEDIK